MNKALRSGIGKDDRSGLSSLPGPIPRLGTQACLEPIEKGETDSASGRQANFNCLTIA